MTDRTGTRGGTVRSVPAARGLQESQPDKARYSLLVRERITETLLQTGYFHADDLAVLEIPEAHCNVIGSQIALFVSKGYMEKVGERKCEHKAANARKAGIYRLTNKGGKKLRAGVGAGCRRASTATESQTASANSGAQPTSAPPSAEVSEHVPGGEPLSAPGDSRTDGQLFEMPERTERRGGGMYDAWEAA